MMFYEGSIWRQELGLGADESGIIGRAPREEEDAQGPREEENHLHEALCECHDDGGEEEG